MMEPKPCEEVIVMLCEDCGFTRTYDEPTIYDGVCPKCETQKYMRGALWMSRKDFEARNFQPYLDDLTWNRLRIGDVFQETIEGGEKARKVTRGTVIGPTYTENWVTVRLEGGDPRGTVFPAFLGECVLKEDRVCYVEVLGCDSKAIEDYKNRVRIYNLR